VVKKIIMNEFDIIAKYFAPLSIDGLKDDAAVLALPAGHELVVSSDTLNEGTHFMTGAAPADIAHKALRASISDLAAMGADLLSYQLNIAFPDAPAEAWLAEFTAALAADQQHFGIQCSGGDTTSIKGALSISITALGCIPSGRQVARSGAQDGDIIMLTGPVGDAFIGLEILRGAIKPQDPEPFLEAYHKPRTACEITREVRAHARAAIDVSDGLLADISHMAAASNLRAVINAADVPISKGARALVEQGAFTLESLIAGGDDYVLACAVAPENVDAFVAALAQKGFVAARIGLMEAGDSGLILLDVSGEIVQTKQTGWSHF